MYLSADDARSDFFLAAAVYVIGPALISLLTSALPQLFQSLPAQYLLLVAVPVLTIAAMPLFLLNYREESFAGLLGGGPQAGLTGFGLGLIFVVPLALTGLLVTEGAVGLLRTDGVSIARALAVNLSLPILAIFLHRRAEYAFRPISERQSQLVRQAGIAIAASGGVAALLLVLSGRSITGLLGAAGLAGMLLAAERLLPQSGIGERWWVWAPVITLALGPLDIFGFLLGGEGFLLTVEAAAVAAALGLITVMALSARRGGAVAFGVGISYALAGLLAAATFVPGAVI